MIKMKKRVFTILLISLLVAFNHIPSAGTAEAGGVADTVLINGKIYTLNPDQPWAEAVAITDGKFTFVGSSAEVEQYRASEPT